MAAQQRIAFPPLMLFGFTLALAAAPLVPAPVAAQEDAPPVGASYFGVTGAEGAAEAVEALGAGWEQVTVAWDVLQPGGPDDSVMEALDLEALDIEALDIEALDAARAAGREVVGLIVGTPPWASASGDRAAVPDGLALPADDPGNVWAAFVRALVTAAAPLGVHQWAIYDAPNVRLGEGVIGFAGDVADYARLVQVAADAARAADPEAQIHLAAFDWWADEAAGREPYLARLLGEMRASAGDDAPPYPFDVVRLRVRDSTAAIADVVGQVRAILEAAGLAGAPIWLEAGARVTEAALESADVPLFGITPQMQADYVMQAAALALALGVERFAIGPLIDPADEAGAGLLAADGSLRPAYAAYQDVIALFAPTTAATLYTTADAAAIWLAGAERDLVVLWARGERAVQFVVTSGAVNERAQVQAARGHRQYVRSEPYDWPAAFTLDVPAARRDQNGFLTVAGSPRTLIFDPAGEWYRVIYAVVDGVRFRLR